MGLAKRKKKEEDDESAVLPLSVHDTDGAFQRSWETFWREDHSSNTVSYLKSLRIEALESYEALELFCAIGVSAPALPRESSDSLLSPQLYG